MGSLYDYIKWRGDLTFLENPLNEVDSLIFSLLSYLDLEEIVPNTHESDCISIKKAADIFFSRHPDIRKYSMGLIVPKNIVKVFQLLKDTKRFGNVGMKAFVNKIDLEKEMQFSAVTFLPGDGSTLVTYRGTDDTLVGWKENFNMSFLPVVPAQTAATAYLNAASKTSVGPIKVTGHSKGGNLAVYAAVHCEDDVKPRIQAVWSNDGPGFSKEFLESKDYIKMRRVIKTLVPQSSIIGMLLEHEETYTVIKSRQAGPFQHDGLTWEVIGGSFVHLKDVTNECKRIDKTLKAWLCEMSLEQREQFVEALYQILSADHAKTLTDLVSVKNGWLKKSGSLDPQVKKTVQKTLSALLEANAKSIISSVKTRLKK